MEAEFKLGGDLIVESDLDLSKINTNDCGSIAGWDLIDNENNNKGKNMKSCKECEHIGDYTDGVYSRNPHYCCELIWELFEEDYRVDPDTIDEKCPLKNIDVETLKQKFYE